MINEITIKECRLEKEFNKAKEIFKDCFNEIKIFISTSKRTEKIITLNRGGYVFDIKSNDLLEKEYQDFDLQLTKMSFNPENLLNLVVISPKIDFPKKNKVEKDFIEITEKEFLKGIDDIQISTEDLINSIDDIEIEKLKEV